jgi:microcystin-dependent protein
LLKVSARIFPIGYIISVDNPDFDPHDFYIDGVWEQIKGRVIVGVDENQTEFNTTGKTGGEKTHTLTVSEMPSHHHGIVNENPADQSRPRVGYGEGKGTLNGLRPSSTSWRSNSFEGYLETLSAGGNQAHNNLQPYLTCYIWTRTE